MALDLYLVTWCDLVQEAVKLPLRIMGFESNVKVVMHRLLHFHRKFQLHHDLIRHVKLVLEFLLLGLYLLNKDCDFRENLSVQKTGEKHTKRDVYELLNVDWAHLVVANDKHRVVKRG